MPKVNQRRSAISAVERLVLLDHLTENSHENHELLEDTDTDQDDSDEDICALIKDNTEDLTSLISLRFYLEHLRYIDRIKVPKNYGFARDLLPFLDELRFRQELRLNRATFYTALDKIKDNKIFTSGSNCSQVPVEQQLATALYRFGTFGNGVSVGKVARAFGISEGTADAYTRRVIVALLSLEQETVRWPNEAEKRAGKASIENEFYFPSCLGFVDGTDIVLFGKPARNGEDYFSRKRNYSISAMIVCNAKKRIIYTTCGFTGSTHDSRVYKNSMLWKAPGNFFEKDEYLLADSIYTCTTTVLPPYRKSESAPQENRRFNYQHSRTRVAVEQCIGMIKNRFQSLKGLRILIQDKSDHARAIFWFRACCVLHNICIDAQDEYHEKWGKLPLIACAEHGNEAGDVANPLEQGPQKRERIKQCVLPSLEE